ncbi:6,7-dimethyl-8-ribityllumazine synthase [bacterium]|nr:6,7-dimethyl-8-ribityllumazine synthase [bacterium]
MQIIEGQLVSPAQAQLRIALVAARFNELIVKELISGAHDTLLRMGVLDQNISLLRVPGAYELPHVAKLLADSKRVDGIIALGCVIRGDTAHFDFVAQAANSGLMQINTQSAVPVTTGVLTVENLDQALARAGSKAGNKGSEAALALLEVLHLKRAIAAWVASS